MVIVGGGFGGLYAARRLGRDEPRLRLITGQPLLPDIAEPEPPA